MKKRVIAGALAAITAIGMLAGCKGSDGNSDVTTIKWCIPTVMEGEHSKEVIDKANGLLRERYKMDIDFIAIDSGNYASKMQVMDAGQEEYDLCFASQWCNNIFKNISKGAYTDISDMIKEHAPTLYESMSKNVWEAAKVDGKLYAVPNWQVQARASSVNFPTEKLEKVGMNINDINTMEDIGTYLEKLHSVEPESNDANMMFKYFQYYYGLSYLVSEDLPCGIYYGKDGKPEVVNITKTPEYKEYLNYVSSWVNKGYLTSNYLPDSKAIENKKAPFYLSVYNPSADGDAEHRYGYQFNCKQFSPAVITTDGITSAMTAVGATSKHPEKAVEMLEIMNKDKEIFNLLCWGIEGVDYEKIGDNQIKVTDTSSYSISNWVLGSVANSFVLNTQDANLWNQVKEFNDSSIVSPLLGCNIVTDNINGEIANCENAVSQYAQMLELGIRPVDSDLEALQKALDTAKIDTVIKEIQSQIDEWWSKK